MRRRIVELVKKSINQMDSARIAEQLERLANKAIGKTFHGFGWRATYSTDHEKEDDGHKYKAKLSLYKKQRRERENSNEVFDKQFTVILEKLIRPARTLGWVLAEEQCSEEVKKLVAKTETAQEPTEIKLAVDFGSYFAHIFDRDPQIRIIYAAIEAAVKTSFHKCNHCLLWGQPACAKSEILLAFERMLGVENVVRLDATATTKAGAESLLIDLERIPPVMILEEAEKVNPLNLSWLLGVLDQRGEILKTNARIGSIRREARCLCLATVNNLVEFKGIMSGALASRFQHKIYCPRPTEAVLRKILQREVSEIGGNPAWITPALRYCIDVEKTNDPRRIISVLDGEDKLLDGSYQKDLMAIREAMERDSADF